MIVKSKSICAYDLVSLGEVMLRLDPGDSRIRSTRKFDVWEGGGEYNVARCLSKCFGLRTGIVTAFVENDIGWLLKDLIQQGGVDTEYIQWIPFDGTGTKARNGLNFTERGFGVRGMRGVSDRGHTAVSQLKPGDVDWDELFRRRGVRWLHTGGIFTALSETTPEVAIEAFQAARRCETIISYDLNYRASLWNAKGGIESAQEINGRLVSYVDVLLGTVDDYVHCLGIEKSGFVHNDPSSYLAVFEEMQERFPKLQAIATTICKTHNASSVDWSGLCYADGKLYKSKEYIDLPIYDRVGAGDSFSAGFIYGLMEQAGYQKSLDYGVASGAITTTTPGDTMMSDVSEVKTMVDGFSAKDVR